MQYEAVIKNPAFPLNSDVECELIMTYQYGAEDPYELIFKPKDTKNAKFKEAKVQWYKLERYDTEELKAPDFPSMIPWAELEKYPGRKGDLINVFDVLNDEFRLLNEGYYTYDISGTFMRKDKDNKWFGEFPFIKDGEKIKVTWSQRDWDKESTPPDSARRTLPSPTFSRISLIVCSTNASIFQSPAHSHTPSTKLDNIFFPSTV